MQTKCPETFLGYIHCRIWGQESCEIFVALAKWAYCIVCMVKCAGMLQSDICYFPKRACVSELDTEFFLYLFKG